LIGLVRDIFRGSNWMTAIIPSDDVMEMIRAQYFLVVATLALVLCSGHSRAQQDFDRESYHRAVEFCRGSVPRPMALSSDRQVLCFDGAIVKDMDVSLARRLNEAGLFVVRSSGGSETSAIVLSDLIRERRGTVVVYDYCLSACAVFFLVASHQTFVVKGALVAWHHPQSTDASRPLCTSLQVPIDGGPKKLRRGPCQSDSPEFGAFREGGPEYVRRFFKERAVSPLFEAPPDSLYVRKIIRSQYAETGAFRDVAWTIHPRYYPTLFKTRIIHEAYPESQGEVDSMVSQLHLDIRVIYDP
jgi:hypothetical protein